MSNGLTVLDEPPIEFCFDQQLVNPQDGLSIFGPYSALDSYHPKNIGIGAIGTINGISSLANWMKFIQAGFHSKNRPEELRSWPPFPGFEAAFHCQWSAQPAWEECLNEENLIELSELSDPNQRSFELCNAYLDAIDRRLQRDENVHVIVCMIPDVVRKNCRPKSKVKASSDRKISSSRAKGRKQGQTEFFGSGFYDAFDPEQYEYSVDFRRQIKARSMKYGIPIQIIQESTLTLAEPLSGVLRQTLVPLTYRTWNLATTISYKSGVKPWRLATARDGVCYIGTAFRKDPNGDGRSACCAAQMFLDTGDGVVFKGENGPWYSPESKQFHLDKSAAKSLMEGVLKNYEDLGGKALTEIFLHSRSNISNEEFEGYQDACPDSAKLVGVVVQKDRAGVRLLRPGEYAVLRGTYWQINERSGYLWTSGFKPRLATYDGWETPAPLRIDIQHGEAEFEQVAKDILGLTKLNYNSCRLGDSQPVTVKFSDLVGEILVSNPTIPASEIRPQFKFYT